MIPDAKVGGVNFLYVKIDNTAGCEGPDPKKSRKKAYQQNPNILENLTVTVSFRL